MELIEFQAIIATAIFLYVLGIYIMVAKNNVVKNILALEIMVAAINITFMAASSYFSPDTIDPLGRAIVILSIAVGVAVAALAFAYALWIKKHYGSVNLDELKILRW